MSVFSDVGVLRGLLAIAVLCVLAICLMVKLRPFAGPRDNLPAGWGEYRLGDHGLYYHRHQPEQEPLPYIALYAGLPAEERAKYPRPQGYEDGMTREEALAWWEDQKEAIRNAQRVEMEAQLTA